jgi:hypothetical protein
VATVERDLRLAELVLRAYDVVRFLHRFVSRPGAGRDGLNEASELVIRLTDQHRLVAEAGLRPDRALTPATLVEVIEQAGLSARAPDQGFTEIEAIMTHRLATDLSVGPALLRALPRLSVAPPATLADVAPVARATWPGQVGEAAEQEAGAALATVTLPGRTVCVVAGGGAHPEQRLYGMLVGDYLAELMNASALTVVSTTSVCPLCCLDLITLVTAYPRLYTTVRGWDGSRAALEDGGGPADVARTEVEAYPRRLRRRARADGGRRCRGPGPGAYPGRGRPAGARATASGGHP